MSLAKSLKASLNSGDFKKSSGSGKGEVEGKSELIVITHTLIPEETLSELPDEEKEDVLRVEKIRRQVKGNGLKVILENN